MIDDLPIRSGGVMNEGGVCLRYAGRSGEGIEASLIAPLALNSVKTTPGALDIAEEMTRMLKRVLSPSVGGSVNALDTVTGQCLLADAIAKDNGPVWDAVLEAGGGATAESKNPLLHGWTLKHIVTAFRPNEVEFWRRKVDAISAAGSPRDAQGRTPSHLLLGRGPE